MAYSAFLIPIVFSIIGFLFFKHKITWWEILLNVGVTSLIITGVYFICKSSTTKDVEYNSYLINEARYYEPYQTYVRKTCTRQVACGTENYTDSQGKTQSRTKYCTETYDCSYCDDIPEKYELGDTGGHTFNIDQSEYETYVRTWKQKPQFIDLNRDIDYHLGCGKDGDMYRVNWDRKIETSMESTIAKSYDNVLQSNKSAFNYPAISDEQALQLGLFPYPSINNYYQVNLLSHTKFKNAAWFSKKLNYMNGELGPKYFSKVYFLVFQDKDLNIAFKQEAYWSGGNRNEIVVCVGIDKNANIKWVKPFSWTKNKTILPALREDIIKHKNLNNVDPIISDIEVNIKKYFKWRDFASDFGYLTFELSNIQLIIIYVITIISSLCILLWSIHNEENPTYKG